MYNNYRMKLLLLKDNKKLGKRGDIINVADGFAFNSLIPQGIACVASKEVLAKLERENKQKEKELKEKRAKLQQEADKINKKKVTIQSQAKGDKLFGSVGKKNISNAIVDAFGIEVAEENVLLDSPIKELTTREVLIDYGDGIKAGVIVTIVGK